MYNKFYLLEVTESTSNSNVFDCYSVYVAAPDEVSAVRSVIKPNTSSVRVAFVYDFFLDSFK